MDLKTWGLSALTLLCSLKMSGQSGYNDKCNGSLAWLSSTTETRGMRNPAATISASGTYYGINQLSGYNVSRLIDFINTHKEYAALRGKLSVTTGKTKKGLTYYRVNKEKWRALAKAQPQLFTRAQEDFLCQVYLPECFGKLQRKLIQEARRTGKKPLDLTKMHPVVLSLFARSFVKNPSATLPLSKLKKARSLEDVNSESFITSYIGKNAYLKKKALESFRRHDISWKQAQLTAACTEAKKALRNYEASQLDKANPVASARKTSGKTVQKRPVAKTASLQTAQMLKLRQNSRG